MIFEYNNNTYNFIHIPKCGGTYIEIYILKHLYGENNVNINNWREFINNHLIYDEIENNPYHMPFKYTYYSNKNTSNNFSIIRDPLELRLSAYKWLKKNLNYKKSFKEYINLDYLILPNDNKTRHSSFGLTQTEYLENSNAKLFLYNDFNKVLEYIDNIFGKKIKHLKKINVGENSNVNYTDEDLKQIQRIFKQDYNLIENYMKN